MKEFYNCEICGLRRHAIYLEQQWSIDKKRWVIKCSGGHATCVDCKKLRPVYQLTKCYVPKGRSRHKYVMVCENGRGCKKC